MALDFFAGCVGGCAGLLVGHPFDTVKVTLQTQDFKNPMYKGTYDCIKKIIQRDSFKGLYRGLSSPMASISVLNAIVFGVYGNVQRNTSHPDSIMTHFLAGSAAGIGQTVICSPMELVKSRLQVQNDMKSVVVKHKGPMECLKHIYKNEGTRGVFRGYGITVVRDFPGFASYFVSFEWMMRQREAPSAFFTLMAGGLAGTFSWLISFPIDVLKSRLQVDGIDGKPQYTGAIDCMKKSYASEGLSFFTRGLAPTLLRAFPMNAVCFLVVSYIMKFFNEPSSIDVTIKTAEPLALVDPTASSSFLFKVHHNTMPSFSRYLILLDGFHEASCHNEMMELSDERRETMQKTTYFYQMNTKPIYSNLSEDEMKKPI